jgi:hypothetical protein
VDNIQPRSKLCAGGDDADSDRTLQLLIATFRGAASRNVCARPADYAAWTRSQ